MRFVLIPLLLILIQCQPQPYEFSEDNSSEILKTLSSDDMRGRQAFTPDIDKAADYISNKFDQIDLDKLDSESDYLQKFEVLSIKVKNADIEVGGTEVSPDDFFVLGDTANIEWAETNEIETIQIAEGENFQQRFNEIREKYRSFCLYRQKS